MNVKIKMIDNLEITWLGKAGFRLRGENVTIYMDPYGLSGNIPLEDMADIILLTNEHPQSFDPDSIRIVRSSSTTTLLPENMSVQFRGDARRVEAGDELMDDLCIKGISIEVVPSYKPDASSGPKEAGVGYVITIAGKRIYYAGVTGLIPEMQTMSVDIVILPVGDCTMNEEKAAEAVAIISPKVVIPVSYGCAGIPVANMQAFREKVYRKAPDVEVLFPEDF
ncbi:MBL fold metallo-hydrolase [Methanomethylovorans sp.]|uniref:MBL fold metallo-hydrolase n=1 Tax=Methanomethylovorans sp. TaxID=2758717 RepID=UPI00351BFDED